MLSLWRTIIPITNVLLLLNQLHKLTRPRFQLGLENDWLTEMVCGKLTYVPIAVFESAGVTCLTVCPHSASGFQKSPAQTTTGHVTSCYFWQIKNNWVITASKMLLLII